MNFDFVFLGQSVLKYQVPLEVFVGLNELYETKKNIYPMPTSNLQVRFLMKFLYFIQALLIKRCITHSYVSEDILKWFYSIFDHYLKWNKIREYKMDINSIWVNEMKAGDYNPVHIHQGKSVYRTIFRDDS